MGRGKLADSGISILILTFKRPRLLARSIRAALQNAIRPLEIIVSDDAMSGESRAAIASIKLPDGVTLRHLEGPAISSQAANARAAFEAASHEWVILMHDDDYLLEGAVDHLVATQQQVGDDVDAVYGRQHIVNLRGEVDWEKTRANNLKYCKDEPNGIQPTRLWCALVGQFPNNGMLLRRSIALQAVYPTETEVGQIPVDFHFAIRYANQASGKFVLTSKYTSACTTEGPSILRHAPLAWKYDGHLGYEVLQKVAPQTEAERVALATAADRFAAAGVMGYLSDRQPGRAWKVFRKHWRRMDKPWATRLALGATVILQRLWFFRVFSRKRHVKPESAATNMKIKSN